MTNTPPVAPATIEAPERQKPTAGVDASPQYDDAAKPPVDATEPKGDAASEPSGVWIPSEEEVMPSFDEWKARKLREQRQVRHQEGEMTAGLACVVSVAHRVHS